MRVTTLGATLLYLGVCSFSGVATARPIAWSHQRGFTAKNMTGAQLVDHQIALPIDTAALVAAGEMRSDGADIRVSANCTSTAFLPHWVENPNTASSRVWVRVTLPDGATPLFVHWGNEAATQESNAYAVFDGDDELSNAPFDAMDQYSSGNVGVAGKAQRGFEFRPNEDVILVELGRRVPDASTRYVTLFDAASKEQLSQAAVPGAAGEYAYASVTPRMLTAGSTYTVAVYQGDNEQHYFSSSSSLDARLTYLTMRYCQDNEQSACSKDTFPNMGFTNAHYGYADFRFLTRAEAEPQPLAFAGVGETTDCDIDGSVAVCGDGTENMTAGEQCDDGNTDPNDTCTYPQCHDARCGDQIVRAGIEACDDGNEVDDDACHNDCTLSCGDGVVQPSVEDCDDENDVDTDACRNNCRNARCGDGVTQAGVEMCDDGNDVDTDACRNACVPAACGDGVVQANVESCDDGNDVDTDDCTRQCKEAACGDGTVHGELEDCDDGNTNAGDGCSAACSVEVDGGTPPPAPRDAGSEPGEDAAVDASPDAAADSGNAAPRPPRPSPDVDPTTPSDEGGCTCRTVGAPARDPGFATFGVFFGVVWLWRRKRRR
jgi:cysteine-rich repeat protein